MSEPKCPKCGVTMYDDQCCLYCGYGLPQLTPEDREACDKLDLTNLFGPLDEQLKRAIDFGMRQFREVKRLQAECDKVRAAILAGGESPPEQYSTMDTVTVLRTRWIPVREYHKALDRLERGNDPQTDHDS